MNKIVKIGLSIAVVGVTGTVAYMLYKKFFGNKVQNNDGTTTETDPKEGKTSKDIDPRNVTVQLSDGKKKFINKATGQEIKLKNKTEVDKLDAHLATQGRG